MNIDGTLMAVLNTIGVVVGLLTGWVTGVIVATDVNWNMHIIVVLTLWGIITVATILWLIGIWMQKDVIE